jgi:uncharacterized protein involved in exopolysaccharide biosynthesis
MEKGNNSGDITIKELIETAKNWIIYLLGYFKLILIVAVVGAVLGICYSLYKKPIYTATLTFALDEEKSAGGLSSALAGQLGLDLNSGAGGMFMGGNLIELFKSRRMVEKALLNPINKTSTLAEVYISKNKIRESWENEVKFRNIKFIPNPNRVGFTRIHDSILGVISESIIKSNLVVVQKEKKVSIITVEYKSEHEDFAKSFAENLANEVSEFYIETKSKKAKKNLAILMRQTDSIRAELNSAITGVAAANDNTFGLNPAMNIRRVPSSRRTVDVQANSAILTELVKQTELAKVTVRKDTPLIQIIDKPILPLPKERFGKLKGIIFGGLLTGFLAVFALVIKKLIKEIQL